MAYPEPSDFRSGEPLAAWFRIGSGEGRTVNVATQGMTANRRIQRALNEYGAGRTSVFGAPLREDGIIGDATLARLFTAAREHASADPAGGYGTIAERIASDRRSRTLSPLSYRWALWLAYVRNNPELRGRGWENVLLPANTTLPAFNGAPDSDRNAGGANLQAVTWLEGVQAAPQPQPRSATSTPVGSSAPSPGTSQPQVVTTGTEPGTPSTTSGGSSSALSTTSARASAPVAALETPILGVKAKWLLGGVALLGLGYLAMKDGKRRGGGARRASRSTTVVYRYGSGRRARRG